MENDKVLQNLQELEEENDDALSLCNLPLDSEEDADTTNKFFQENPNPENDVFEFFTNPNIPSHTHSSTQLVIFCGKMIPHKEQSLFLQPNTPAPARSSSLRLTATEPGRHRKHMFAFGMVKFPPEMELGDLRRRQSRRTPAPMFPADAAGEISGGGRRRGGHWGLLRLLKCRSRFGITLARTSIGCLHSCEVARV